MGLEEEVQKIRRELTKANSNKLVCLKALQEINLDQKTLFVTSIGSVVNQLRCTSKDENVVSLAENLIDAWKKFPLGKAIIEKDDSASTDATKSTGLVFSYGKRKLNKGGKSTFSAVQNTATAGDYVRLTCQELLIDALSSDHISQVSEVIKDKALELEEAIYLLHKDADDEYDDCITTRVMNLKKKKILRRSFLCNRLNVQQLAKMTAKELVNFEIKKLSDKLPNDGTKSSS